MKSEIAVIPRVGIALLMIFFLGACWRNQGGLSGSRREELADVMESSMQKELLNVWYPKALDNEHGGFMTTYTFDFTLGENQDKMIVSQARHTWVNAKASILYPDQTHYRESAAHGFQFLRDVMWDETFGGFYTLVSREGKVIDSTKNAYGNSFGIFALAAVFHATKDTSAINLAKEAFLWLEKNSHDSVHNGYFQHMNRDGSRIIRHENTASQAETGYKDQNSSIHLLEAFTELYQVWPDPLLRKRLSEMLYLIRDTITTKRGYLQLFFTTDWKPVTFQDSSREVIEKHHGLDHVSFGHDVETAFLMMEASHVLGIENDTTTLRIARHMVDHALNTGWDHAVGGFYDGGYYFKGDSTLTVVKDSKNWWAQAEGLNTLLIMADKFPDDPMKYDEKFNLLWKYIDTNLIDHTHGDWYAGGLDKEPFQKTALKGHQWKATYHHFRALSHCIARLRGKDSM